MFRLLIADDEDLVRRGLAALIEREAPDLVVVGVADDGPAALELAEQQRPDIMLTDIRMPGLSGLELIARLRDDRPDLQCIVLSGYDDFEYARRSISLDVAAYLLKPVDPDQLLSALAQAQQRLTAQRNAARVQERAQEALTRAYLRRLLDGHPNGAESEPGCLAPAQAWGLLLLQAGAAPDGAPAGFSATLEACCRLTIAGATLVDDQDGYSCLVAPLEQAGPEAWGRQALALHDALNGAGWEVSITAARPAEDPALLGAVRAEAIELHEARCSAAAPLLCWEAAPTREGGWPVLPLTLTDDLLQAVSRQGEEAAARAACRLLDYLREHSTPGVRTLLPQVMLMVIQQVQRHGVQPEVLLGDEPDLRALLARGGERSKSEAQLVALVRRAAHACEQLGAIHNVRGTIPELRAYIAEHLNDDLSISALGRQMHLNPKYLAELFKQVCGQPLGEYIIHARMRRACELLAGTTEKVYTIAERVGYGDPKHFATMFRQVIGMSPADYRGARQHACEAGAGHSRQ